MATPMMERRHFPLLSTKEVSITAAYFLKYEKVNALNICVWELNHFKIYVK